MTLYQTLEVAPHASPREIQRSFRRLARRYHPDLNPDDPASEEKFKEVVAAYEVLSDRERRAAYDAQASGVVTNAPGHDADAAWKGPERSTREWKDFERDLRRWRHRRPFDPRDAQFGALVAVSVTLAFNASREAAPFLHVLIVALTAGLIALMPFRAAHTIAPEPVRALAGWLGPIAATYAAMLGSALATATAMPTLWGSSGIPFAFLGGGAGAVAGSTLGRTFREASEPIVGVLVGGASGAVVGAIVGGFFWYWTSIFRWMEWPVRDDLSLLASTGVVGALLGAALAAALGGSRVAP